MLRVTTASCCVCIGLTVAAVLLVPSRLSAQAPEVRYRVTSTAVLALERTPQSPLVDTVTTTSILGISVSVAADTTATLSVDSLQFTSTGMIKRTSDAFTRGVSVAAILRAGRPLTTGDTLNACSKERPFAALLPELLPLLPTPLRAEQQWSDTVTVTTCRAGLPVTTTAIAAYRTLTGMDSTTVLLERRATLLVSGAAVIRTQAVTLTGSGLSESLGVVALASRQWQSWRSTQSLEFQISNGQQTRRMTQTVTDSAVLLP
jgi:hypothetical protein